MKIAIISDTHFGLKENQNDFALDSYLNAEQAFQYSLQNYVDLILMPGDIFDLEIPTQETYHSVFKLFSELIGEQKIIPKDKTKTITKIPLVVIPGTHEYRGKNYKGPIDVLESAGYIYKLGKEHILFENNNEKIAIHGMKGVPEKVSKDLLLKIDFQPVPDFTNILMLHQSFKEFLPFDDEMVATLTLEDLPNGFDLYINGHIHLSNIIKTEKGTFVLAGSTVLTQIKKAEIEKRKGFHIYDTKTKNLEFVEISVQREYYLREIKIDGETKEDIINKIKIVMEETKKLAHTYEYNIFDTQYKLRPVLKIKITGKISSGFKQSDISAKDFVSDDLIIILDKELDSKELEEKIKEIDLGKDREKALIQSQEIFFKNLETSGFKKSFEPAEILNLLKNGDIDKAIEEIIKEE